MADDTLTPRVAASRAMVLLCNLDKSLSSTINYLNYMHRRSVGKLEKMPIYFKFSPKKFCTWSIEEKQPNE